MGKAFAYYTEGSFFYLGVDPSIFGGSNVFKGTFYCECSNERSLALSLPRYSVVFDQEASRLVSSIREQLMDVSGDYKHQESTPSRFSL
ncbi:unnamed protein product [Linum tenue]|uniref:Choline/carnitine acyltransferase domain-containing protein n=1 Tax=Linum tenue TaxID=586396 RepID=A0AAV0RKV7_9ROSI|nr:unnamed protein product [Linum tenue]